MSTEYRFGRYVLRPAQRRLWEDGAPLALGARAFDLLLVLLENRGRTVTRDELFDRVWPGRVVGDDNLKMQVLALRKLLGADIVVTVPRLGYRFGLEVQTPSDAAQSTPVAAAAEAGQALIGRADELAFLQQAVRAQRLVTVLGSAGIGKTRLALAAAAALAGQFGDGTRIVDLSALDNAEGHEAALLSSVQRALGLAAASGAPTAVDLARSLRSLSLLVVLDNCEHVLAAMRPLVTAVLHHAAGVHLLATSQAPLGVVGEQLMRLEPLALPVAGAPLQPADVANFGALALFRARVAALQPGLPMEGKALEDCAAICRRLDGVPLALELAAARVPLLGVAGVLARLDRPLSLLTAGTAGAPTRQQTLRAAMAWSIGLLSPTEQQVFDRLGVFVGSFALPAAQQVAGSSDEIEFIDTLGSLHTKSLLQVLPGSTPRYRLLESARAMALERLQDAGDTAALRRRHAQATLADAQAIDADHIGTPLLHLDERVQPELGNLRAALSWALGSSGDPALAVALAAWGFTLFSVAGLYDEGGRALEATRTFVEDHAEPRLQAAWWLALANRGADSILPAQQAYDAALHASTLFRALGDAEGLVRSLSMLQAHGHRIGAGHDAASIAEEMRAVELPGWNVLQRRPRRWLEARAAVQRGQWQVFADRMRDEVELLQQAGDDWRAWVAAHNVALAEITLKRPLAGVDAMQPMVAQIRARGLVHRCWPQVAIHAMACIAAEDADLAASAVREAVGAMRVAGTLPWMCTHLAWWVMQQARRDPLADPAAVARIGGWAAARVAGHGETLGPHVLAAREQLDGWLASRLADADLAAWRAEGARLGDDEAALLVLRACG